MTLASGIGAVNISADAANTTINVATGAGVKALTLGSTNTTSSTTLQSGSGALNITSTGGAITINSGVGALGISTDASATAVSIANGAAVKTVILGSTNTTSTTTINSGSGNVNVTGGNLKIATTGKGLQVKGGVVTDMVGTAVLVLGTVTVANTNIATGDLIFPSRIASNGSVTLGMLSYTISNGVSFTINSLILGTPASVQTADVSSVAYFIVRPV
jgi:hypothetical protein